MGRNDRLRLRCRHGFAAATLLVVVHGAGTAAAQEKRECVPPLEYVHDGDCTAQDKADAQNGNCTVRLDGTDRWCCCEPRTGPDEPDEEPEVCTPPTEKVHDGSCTQNDFNSAVDGNCTDRLQGNETVCCCEVSKDGGGGCTNCASVSRPGAGGFAVYGLLPMLGLLGALRWRRAAKTALR